MSMPAKCLLLMFARIFIEKPKFL